MASYAGKKEMSGSETKAVQALDDDGPLFVVGFDSVSNGSGVRGRGMGDACFGVDQS